ncbi:hypothetical protein JYK02_35480 [Corallococcus macrosporus]|uniref:Uncharacterized protein n=1 Tax=Corallococcus macrosporus TaxID=35 RepID=A0ABS3DNB9_9BACT|nr:hypothetical protein [Corallococcus macrosporus]MBN8232832.1 hypothetical protein [Corallococcus macrosporus]
MVLARDATSVHEEGPGTGVQLVARCFDPLDVIIQGFLQGRSFDARRRKQRLHFDVHRLLGGAPRAP